MKFNLTTSFPISLLMAVTLSAYAGNEQISDKNPELFTLIQKNCTPGDLTIEKNDAAKSITTDCKWKLARTDNNGKDFKEDADMQLTLHMAPNVDSVGMHCIFIPAAAEDGRRDKIADIAATEAGGNPYSMSPEQLQAGSWLSYVTDTASGQTEIFAIITNNKLSYDVDKMHNPADIIFDLNTQRKKRGWWTNVQFHENNSLTCTFAPNVIPVLSSGASTTTTV